MKSQGYRNPTAETATGKAAKEWREMARLALKIRSNTVSPKWAAQQEARFIGIYRRLLEDPLFEVEKEAR